MSSGGFLETDCHVTLRECSLRPKGLACGEGDSSLPTVPQNDMEG